MPLTNDIPAPGLPPTIYDHIELLDCTPHPDKLAWTYPCPCGDLFTITLQELQHGTEIATCPSCSLVIQIIWEEEDIDEMKEEQKAQEMERQEKSNMVDGNGTREEICA